LPEASVIRRLIREGRQSEALSGARALAASGSPEGDLLLGWMHQSGAAVPQDLDEAERYYIRAAEHGSSLGMFYLGWFYATAGDLTRAVEWFQRSSTTGCPAATYHLGRMHLVGQGVEQNHNRAMELFATAAHQGHLYARRNIAREMATGKRGLVRIPLGILEVLQVGFLFVSIGLKDPDSERLLRI